MNFVFYHQNRLFLLPLWNLDFVLSQVKISVRKKNSPDKSFSYCLSHHPNQYRFIDQDYQITIRPDLRKDYFLHHQFHFVRICNHYDHHLNRLNCFALWIHHNQVFLPTLGQNSHLNYWQSYCFEQEFLESTFSISYF